MSINSRAKGKRGERQAAAYLSRLGFDARRGQQHRGGPDAPDVIVADLPAIHVEVKHRAAIDLATVELDDAMAQADRDATGGGADRVPVVLWKRNRTAWRLTWIEAGVQLTTTGDAEVAATLRRLNVVVDKPHISGYHHGHGYDPEHGESGAGSDRQVRHDPVRDRQGGGGDTGSVDSFHGPRARHEPAHVAEDRPGDRCTAGVQATEADQS